MGLRPDEVDAQRATVESFLSDPCTNRRTGQSGICSVDDGGRDQRLPGRPNVVKLRVWLITLAYNFDVEVRDILIVPGTGTYAVTSKRSPETNDSSTDVEAIMVSLDANNHAVIPEPNALVTFTGTKAGQTVSDVPAVLKPTDPNGTLGRFAAEFPWTVDIAEGTGYPDGALVAAKHQVTFQRRPGVTVTATLGKSHPDYDAVVPTVSFVFSEQD